MTCRLKKCRSKEKKKAEQEKEMDVELSNSCWAEKYTEDEKGV